jgi:hypothetical protein
VNGVPTAGVLPQLTGDNGCVIASVTTAGVTGNIVPRVVFFTGDASVSVDIVITGQILQASPSVLFGDVIETIHLTLLDFSGGPVNGVFLVGECSATGDGEVSLDVPPGVTGVPQPNISQQNGPGQTSAVVRTSGFECQIVPASCSGGTGFVVNGSGTACVCPTGVTCTGQATFTPAKDTPPAGTGSCTFQTASGAPKVVVPVKGKAVFTQTSPPSLPLCN